LTGFIFANGENEKFSRDLFLRIAKMENIFGFTFGFTCLKFAKFAKVFPIKVATFRICKYCFATLYHLPSKMGKGRV